MFRQVSYRLLTRSTNTYSAGAAATLRRPYATEVSADTAPGDSAFSEAWKKVAPTIDPPKTPIQFMEPRPPTPSSLPAKLTVNFVLPYSSELSKKEVDMVIVPTTTGQMGILPGHVPTIAELKPGLLSVHEGSDIKKYFISSGFAFVHSNSYADILAVEAVPLDRIDPAQVQKGLSEFTQTLGSASSDLDKAEAQLLLAGHLFWVWSVWSDRRRSESVFLILISLKSDLATSDGFLFSHNRTSVLFDFLFYFLF